MISGTDYADTIRNSGSNVTIAGSADIDSIYSTNGHYVSINGGSGDDNLTLISNNSTVFGGDGNDTINVTGIMNTINSGSGDDSIKAGGENVYMYASGDGNDTIVGCQASDVIQITDGSNYSTMLSGDDVIVSLESGSMLLKNAAEKSIKIIGGKYVSSGNNISNTTSNTLINGTEDADTIRNTGSNVTISGSAGNDSVYSSNGSYVSINGGSGDDTLTLIGKEATVIGGDGDDYINVTGLGNTIEGGKGNDTIKAAGENVYIYTNGDGNDIIIGFGNTDTIRITNGAGYLTMISGDDVIVSIGSGSMLLKNAANKTININGGKYVGEDTTPGDDNTINGGDGTPIGGDDDYINPIINVENNVKLSGTDNADSINNTGENVTIQGNRGNDIITGDETFGDLFIFAATDDNDTITNFSGEDSLQIISGTIDSTVISGNDVIINVKGTQEDGSVTLKDVADKNLKLVDSVFTLDEEHEIINSKDNVKVTGTSGNDYIVNSGNNVTINGGLGDDTVEGSDYGELIQFGASDGNDLITNFGTNDTLQITGGTLSTAKSGNDLILSLKSSTSEGTITLRGAGNHNCKTDGDFLTLDDINYINNTTDNKKVTGTSGKDYITNSGENVTIQAGKGSDTIEGSSFGETFLFSYASM